MSLDINIIVNILIGSFFAILFVLFTYQTTRKHRSAPYLLTSIFFGVLGAFFAFVDSVDLLPNFTTFNRIYLILELMFYGLQFFFFYLFVQDISRIRPQLWSLILMFAFLIIQNMSLWLMVWFSSFSATAVNNLWLFADIGYNNLAIFAFWIIGIPTYYRLYDYTKEKKALGFIFGLILVGGGYVVGSLIDYIGFFGTVPSWLNEISILGEIFPLVGLLIFLLTYILDVDYIYRLPHDHYMLMVTYRSGVAIHTVKFNTKRQVQIEENLFSGFISSLTFVFDNILQSISPIEIISSKDASILMRSGENILVIILTQQPTSILARASDRYIKRFEDKFRDELKIESTEVGKFQEAEELIKPIFPFLKIKDNSEKKPNSKVQ